MRYQLEFNHKDKDFEDVWKIEYEYLEPSTIASVKQTIEWDNKNPDINIFVRDITNNKIVGEITMLPLSKHQFCKFIDGTLKDTEINKNTLLKYESNNTYYLLFSAIAIDINYRNDKLVLSYLLKGLEQKIKSLLNRNIKFANMCAEGQTKDGQKFIENFLNLNYRITTKDGYKLYSFDDTDSFNKWFATFPIYIDKYNKKYAINI